MGERAREWTVEKELLVNASLVNQVIEGDCLDVMKYIPEKSIDMILCDLPYGTT